MALVWALPPVGVDAGVCPVGPEVDGCPLVGCCVCTGGFSGATGCSGVAVCSGFGSGLGVLGRIWIFSAMGCNRSGGG